jgi:hypothetical protein
MMLFWVLTPGRYWHFWQAFCLRLQDGIIMSVEAEVFLWNKDMGYVRMLKKMWRNSNWLGKWSIHASPIPNAECPNSLQSTYVSGTLLSPQHARVYLDVIAAPRRWRQHGMLVSAYSHTGYQVVEGCHLIWQHAGFFYLWNCSTPLMPQAGGPSPCRLSETTFSRYEYSQLTSRIRTSFYNPEDPVNVGYSYSWSSKRSLHIDIGG